MEPRLVHISLASALGYWIQIGGASIVSGRDIHERRWREPPDASFDDAKDLDKFLKLLQGNPSRASENLVASQKSLGIHSALLVSPVIYAEGRGPCNTRGIQAPEVARTILQRGADFVRPRSESEAASMKRNGLWREDGVYFVEHGEMTFGHLCEIAVRAAHSQGLIPFPATETRVSGDEADALSGQASLLLGSNAVVRASRAQVFGWRPRGVGLVDYIS